MDPRSQSNDRRVDWVPGFFPRLGGSEPGQGDVPGMEIRKWEKLDGVLKRKFQKRKFDGLCKQAKNDENFFRLEKQNCLFRKFQKRKF